MGQEIYTADNDLIFYTSYCNAIKQRLCHSLVRLPRFAANAGFFSIPGNSTVGW